MVLNFKLPFKSDQYNYLNSAQSRWKKIGDNWISPEPKSKCPPFSCCYRELPQTIDIGHIFEQLNLNIPEIFGWRRVPTSIHLFVHSELGSLGKQADPFLIFNYQHHKLVTLSHLKRKCYKACATAV